MSFRRKKSLTIVLFGLVLFLFAFSLREVRIGESIPSNKDATGSDHDLRFGSQENNSLRQKTSKLLQEPRQIYSPQSVHKHENIKTRDTLKIISLENPVKVPLSRIKYQEKSTASRDFLRKTGKIKAGAGQMKKRFPTAIILGVKKAGTRALLEILRMHPNVIGASNEVYFFNGYHNKGLEWYRQQMPVSSPGQMTIEKSPTYFTSVEKTQVVNRMFIFSRSTEERLKLIVVVRDPVKRCVSEYTDMVARSKKNETPPVDDFEKLILHGNGTVNGNSELVKTGLYNEHLKKWLEYFLENEIHFVSGEELAKNPLKEIQSLEKFLELEPFFTEKNFRYSKVKRFPCFVPDPTVTNAFFCLPSNKGRKHANIKGTTLEMLRRFYRPFNVQFYSTVKRNFNWA